MFKKKKNRLLKKSKGKSKKFLETNDNDNSKPIGSNESSSKREVYSNTILPQETRKPLNRQPNFTSKTTGKRRTKKPPNQ